jgi:hypothetical protein
MATGGTSKNMHGDKLYQRRARMALPLLVRQAHAGSKIFYADLAAELGMTNPRTLNYVLGSIGTTLKQSADAFGGPIAVRITRTQCSSTKVNFRLFRLKRARG